MNKELLKKIIVENQEFIRDITLLPRDLTIEENGNYVFTGARRSGKTFSMFHIIKDMLAQGISLSTILYINFEDERLLEITGNQLDSLLEAYKELFTEKPVMFLDEIQNVSGWEKFARRLADTSHKVFITGSNAKMLSREIATTLGGRYLIKEIYPLSFREYLQMNNVIPEKNWEYTEQRFEIRKLFDDYFYYGGFPEIIRFSEKRLWLANLYQKIFYGDIIARYKIRNDFALKLLIKKLAESTHDEISFNRIRHIIQSAGIKIGTATLIEYIKYLEESWLIYGIKNYFGKIGERETSGKYYFVDNGILSLFLINPETILLENIVALRLKQQYGAEVYYLKKQTEVDFYIPQKGIMVQASYKILTAETEKREIDGLLKAAQHVETKEMIVVTLDTEKQVSVNGFTINFVPVWKWLLDPSCLTCG